MSGEIEKDGDRDRPENVDKRAALKKIGRYAAYTAPATLVALGYATSHANQPPGSPGGSPPPPLSPPE